LNYCEFETKQKYILETPNRDDILVELEVMKYDAIVFIVIIVMPTQNLEWF